MLLALGGPQAMELYTTIRSEIIQNIALMQWFSIITALALLLGLVVIAWRNTIASVFFPLLSLSWAAAMVRFDFFIHRQAAYLRELEAQMRETGMTMPLWETWKTSIRSTSFVVPIADVFACLVIVAPTLYLLFGPAQEIFQLNKWRGQRVYAWGVSSVLILLLLSLAAIPSLAAWKN